MGKRKPSKKTTPRQIRRIAFLNKKRSEQKMPTKVRTNIFSKAKTKIVIILKKISKLFVFIFFSSVAVLVVYYFLNISNPQKIKAEIFIKENFELSLNDHQISGDTSEIKITPLCGCLISREHRGIQFFSNNIYYEITDTSYNSKDSIHQYEFLSPQSNNGVRPELEFGFQYYLVKSKHFDQLNIEKLIKNNIAEFSYKEIEDTIIKKVDIDSAALISIFTKENRLDIYTSDSFPIAALLPTNNSKINIEKFHHPYQRKDLGFEITENFDILGDIDNGWDIPSLDVFGPRVAIATKPGSLRINRNFRPMEVSDTSYTAVLVFNVAPQLRIVHNKIDSSVLTYMRDSMSFLTFHDTKGKLLLSSYKLEDSKFKELKKRVDSMGAYNNAKKMLGTLDGKELEMDLWGLPTVLKSNGIYAYTHHLAYLRTTETAGAVQYGVKSFSLNGQNDVIIKDIKNDKVYNQPIVVPLDAEDDKENKFKFSADGNLTLDNEVIAYSGFDTEFWKKISFILGLITSAIALLIFFRDILKKENKTEPQNSTKK